MLMSRTDTKWLPITAAVRVDTKWMAAGRTGRPTSRSDTKWMPTTSITDTKWLTITAAARLDTKWLAARGTERQHVHQTQHGCRITHLDTKWTPTTSRTGTKWLMTEETADNWSCAPRHKMVDNNRNCSRTSRSYTKWLPATSRTNAEGVVTKRTARQKVAQI
jgi:hypothetical protein